MIRRCKITKKMYILGGIVSNTNQTLKIFVTNMLLRLRTSIYFTVLYHIASRAANNSMRQFGN